MMPRMAVTLSSGEIVAPGPPMSVRTQPGLITATTMPRGASCSARARIAMFTAAFEVRYIISRPEPTSPIEPMPLVSVSAFASPAAASRSAKASRTRTGPIVLMSRTRAHSR